jgi:uncharacterized Fe-S cluster-containing radical SAM superfamily protein
MEDVLQPEARELPRGAEPGSSPREATAGSGAEPGPTGEAYPSCEWIEGGIAFNRRSLHTCLIAHHHRGLPFIANYDGGPLPLEDVLALRSRIREANRRGDGYPECVGCAHLKRRQWGAAAYPIEIVGIAHYSFCNIACDYCFLQTQDPSSYADGYRPYPLLGTFERLIRAGLLAPNAIVDWGGGEPTVYKEFDELLELLLEHGTFHYLHTNGTRIPDAIRRTAKPSRIHVICSVDAGRPETYLRIKKRDLLERVFENLQEYVRLGVRVTLKYIVTPANCGDEDLRPFMERAVRIGAEGLIGDIDFNSACIGDEIVAALARLKHMALQAGLPARFGFAGDNFVPESNVAARVEAAFRTEQLREIRSLLEQRHYVVGESVALSVGSLIGALEEQCAAHERCWHRVAMRALIGNARRVLDLCKA